MAEQLKEHVIVYLESVLESVRATPNLPAEAGKELEDSIELLRRPNHITFPFAGDPPLHTIETMRKVMDNYFKKYPAIMASPKQIDLQELYFQRLIQNTNLLKPSRSPTSKKG